MKREVTKTQLIAFIKRLDTRCKKYDDDKFDEIIDDAFSELNTIANLFTDEDALDVTGYLEDGVKKLSYDVEKDVIFIYDAFLSTDSKTPFLQSDKMVEVDPRVISRVNIDFTSTDDMYNSYSYHDQEDYDDGTVPETLIVRYYYIPTSEFDSMYMNRDIYKAFRQSLSASVYLDLHDEKKYAMHQATMKRNAKGIVVARPHDFDDIAHLKKFPDGC